MRIYLAGPWAHRADMPAIAEKFKAAGHEITWEWWETPDIPEGANKDAELRAQALNDKRGVETAQLLVLINSAKSEGKATEQGLAIAARKLIIAVGKLGDGTAKNVFHYLPNYHWVDTVDEAVNKIEQVNWVYKLHESIYAS